MTETTDTPRSLPLLEDQTTDSEGCGCGGCRHRLGNHAHDVQLDR